MKLKALLKFYFSADFLNAYLDGAVLKYALNYAGEAEDIADLIFAVTLRKRALNALWGYMDNAFAALTDKEREALRGYARLREGYNSLPREEKNAIKRASAKFSRRAAGINAFAEGIELVKEYVRILAP